MVRTIGIPSRPIPNLLPAVARYAQNLVALTSRHNYIQDMPQLPARPRPNALAKLDGRTREARLMACIRRDLLEHCGANPSATQRALIDRAAWLTFYVAQSDARTAAGLVMTEHDSRQYLAWSNALSRTLSRIGLQGAPTAAPDLADYLATKAPGG